MPESDQYILSNPTNLANGSVLDFRVNDHNASVQTLKFMNDSKVMSEGHTGEVGHSDENKSSNEISAGKSPCPKIDQNTGQRKKYVRKNVTCFDKELVSTSHISFKHVFLLIVHCL